MRTMMLSLAILPALAFAASAQDTSWSDLAVGDRVEVVFRSGSTLVGTLVAPDPKVKTVDYAAESALTLDVTWEYPGLNGTMTVPKKDIKSLRKLRVLDEKSRQRIAEMKAKIAADNAAAANAPKPAPPAVKPETPAEPAPQPEDKAAKEAEELKKALEFYARYPAPDWGPEHKTLILQKRSRGQVPTPAEREFEQNYELWEKGRAASAKKPAEQK